MSNNQSHVQPAVMEAAMELEATADIQSIEAPMTLRGYLMCVLPAFGGIFFGYDSGYVNGVMAMPYFIQLYTGLDPATTPPGEFVLPAWEKSLIVGMLSLGTFIGAVCLGDVSDYLGRRNSIIGGCAVFCVGAILQTASTGIGLFATGRAVAGVGMGGVTAVVVLYVSEIVPRKFRGAAVGMYGSFICVGLLIAACIDYSTQTDMNSRSYRIPTAVQMCWALILAGGMLFLPESPRFYVRKGEVDRAARALGRLRRQSPDSKYVQHELAEIIANHEYELQVVPQTTYLASWTNLFKGGLRKPNSNLRRVIVCTTLFALVQWCGANFIFYFGTSFFAQLGLVKSPFLLSIILTVVNTCSSPLAWFTYDRFGRRPVLLISTAMMCICQLIVAIIGCTTDRSNSHAIKAEIAFMCIYIFWFSPSMGPGPWILAGELFPLPIRARGVGISAASNWFWNCIIGVITPYLLAPNEGNLGTNVFFVWSAACALGVVFIYFMVPETKGLTLEQVDRMLEEVSPRRSGGWKPHSTFAADMGFISEKGGAQVQEVEQAEK